MSEQMAELLRETIRASGMSTHQLAEATGIKQPSISTFLNGTDIRISTAQKLADYFGLVLTIDAKKKSK